MVNHDSGEGVEEHENRGVEVGHHLFGSLVPKQIYFVIFDAPYFRFLLLFCTVGKEIGRFTKNIRSKLSNPTLKKPVSSSLASGYLHVPK